MDPTTTNDTALLLEDATTSTVATLTTAGTPSLLDCTPTQTGSTIDQESDDEHEDELAVDNEMCCLSNDNDPALAHIPPEVRNNADEIRKRNVYVAGLPMDFDLEHFNAIMGEFGPLYLCRLVSRNRRVKRAQRAYAFAVFVEPSDADAAVEGLSGLEMDGMAVTARLAMTAALKTPSTSRGRKKRGGVGRNKNKKRAAAELAAAEAAATDAALCPPAKLEPQQLPAVGALAVAKKPSCPPFGLPSYSASAVRPQAHASMPPPYVAPPMYHQHPQPPVIMVPMMPAYVQSQQQFYPAF